MKLSPTEISQLQATAEAGDAASQVSLGRAYQDGNGLPQNDDLAVNWYRKAAAQGNPTAQNSLGIMYRMGRGVEKNKEEAVEWYRKAARQGHPTAMFNLGVAYYNGDGVSSNIFSAYDWFLLGQDAGNANAREAAERTASEIGPEARENAFLEIAGMYESGTELPQDYREAANWYRKAIEKNNPKARVRLATFFINGWGVQPDFKEAMQLCMDASKAYAPAQYCVGYLYLHGIGDKSDPESAAKWYRKAAQGGHSKAMLELGQMYWKGEGIAQDRIEAYLWLVEAYAAGEPDARGLIIQVSSAMNASENQQVDKKFKKRNLDPVVVRRYIQEGKPLRGMPLLFSK